MRAKINEETVQSMKQSLMLGLSLKDACELEDISPSTWRRYEAKHPDIRRKRKRWQRALELRAKVVIANKVYDKEKPSGYYAQYILNYQLEKETKNAQNALARANARKINAEIERIKAETARLNGDTDALKETTTIIDDIGAIEDAKNKDVKND